jgi:hypothetical protein
MQRAVDDPREIAFDEKVAAHEEAHQTAERRIFAERYKGAKVLIPEGPQGFVLQMAADLPCEMGRLLMCGLGARRH